MSVKSAPDFKSRISSQLSRFKKRVSSVFSPFPSASPSRQHSQFSAGCSGMQGVPSQYADPYLFPPSASCHPSVANGGSVLAHSSPNTQNPSCHLKNSVYQSYSSTHLAFVSPFQPPQGQAPTVQEPSYIFGGAHDFVMNNPVFNDYSTTENNFMEKLLQRTIIGAEFDSSDRDPPPRCHPGTRLAIIQRCLDFVVQCHDEGRLRWVVGPAGVGKSAVMQMVAEKAPDDVIFASLFFSVNGRRDGTKTIMTIAYQLAVQCKPYRQFVQGQITLDPSLLRKSLSVQFNNFIVKPFMLEYPFKPPHRFFIVIDGLDECDNPFTQLKLLKLITDFCLTYPTAPIAWIVTSRPEPHITSFFDKAEVKSAYTKEEMVIDSDDACEEVQRYLRDELKRIQLEHLMLRHKRVWPLEHEFTNIASSAGGLFAYAATVIRYINDPHYGDPAAQLHRVLETIDVSAKDHVAGRDHPMAKLDALYKRILSHIPDDVMINTRKLLLMYSNHKRPGMNFRWQCNRLGLTEEAAYGAICHLHAVMKVPEPDKADDQPLAYFHKSFLDFLFDSKRFGFSDNIKNEVEQLRVHSSLRILEEVTDDSDGVASGGDIDCGIFGHVKGSCDNVSLSWPGDERFQMLDDELRVQLYRRTMTDMCNYFYSSHTLYGSISCFHVLTTRFTALGQLFPFYQIRDSAFDNFRQELIKLGKMKQVPLRTLDYAAICGPIELRRTSPIEIDVECLHPRSPSCKHDVVGVGNLKQHRGWLTSFQRDYRIDLANEDDEGRDIPRFQVTTRQPPHQQCFEYEHDVSCNHCSRRLARQFANNLDQLAMVFVDGTQMCYVELSFVDPGDGVSEWRYRFFHSGPPTGVVV